MNTTKGIQFSNHLAEMKFQQFVIQRINDRQIVGEHTVLEVTLSFSHHFKHEPGLSQREARFNRVGLKFGRCSTSCF